MSRSRDEHLTWCKGRALAILEGGDHLGAVASLISDLSKWDEPLYDALTLQLLIMDGMLFRNTPGDVRHWIEGFA